MRFGEILHDLGGYVSFHPSLTPICGSTNANIFLSNLIAWSGKEASGDGWIYKNSDTIESETGLSYKEQVTARKQLISRSFLEENNKRFEHKIYFRVNSDALSDAWESQKLDFANCPKGVSGTAQRAFRGSTDRQFDSINTTPTTTPTTTVASSGNVAFKEKSKQIDYQGFIDKWNESVEGTPFPRVLSLNEPRRKAIRDLLKDTPDAISMLPAVINHISGIEFFTGHNDRGWVADFAYLTRKGKLVEIYEKSQSNFVPEPVKKETKRLTYADLQEQEARAKQAEEFRLMNERIAARKALSS